MTKELQEKIKKASEDVIHSQSQSFQDGAWWMYKEIGSELEETRKELAIKEIAPYIPYKLKVLRPDGRTILEVFGTQGSLLTHVENMELTYSGLAGCKPLLRPLSDLTKEITVNGETFVPLEKFYEVLDCRTPINRNDTKYEVELLIREGVSLDTYWIYIQKLFEWHFDVFSLIPRGLAIDLNTIEPKK